ncbi:MarR family transcriptional regulator [uncultured Bosea sp.]|uniref:MarR family transcriptional regulator n=1 Tax=uncultured Bosea sp. TaxID=211457 RepID=UPI00263A8C02|nr:MarR family transcriptional regulator [uncultured Bosea sp.]
MTRKQVGTTPESLGGLRTEIAKVAFEDQYPAYQYQMVEFVTEHLADLSRVFRGDLQEMLVLAIIGQLALRAHMTALAEPNPANLKKIGTAITASRLADVTGIPRQTVRRKLKSLEERGWISRTGSASYQLTVTDGQSTAGAELRAVDQRSIERAARLFSGLEKILTNEPPTKPSS